MSFDLSAQAERVYRYCRARCFTSDEAGDVAQQILLTAWASRARIENAAQPERYMMGICRNALSRHANSAARASLCRAPGDPETALAALAAPQPDEMDAALVTLYRRIADLAAQDRALVIGHYLEDNSIRALAQSTGLPEGTVKWRLSLARQTIREEWDLMEPCVPIKPVKLKMMLSGGQPAHNICPELTTPTRCLLLHTLQRPMTAREAAAQTGVPTMLVEQEIESLAALEAVVRLPDGDWAADFFIESLDYQQRLGAAVDAHAPALRAKLLEKFAEMAPVLADIGFETGGKTIEALRPVLLLHLLHDGGEYAGWNPPLRPDGSQYYFMCHEYGEQPTGLLVSDWYHMVPGLLWRSCVPGGVSVADRIGASMERVLNACLKLRKTGRLDGEDPAFVAGLIAAGALRNEGGALSVAVPWFTKPQFDAFEALAKELGAYARHACGAFAAETGRLLKAMMPAHLAGQRELYQTYAQFDLMAGVMLGLWPESAEKAAGLMLVEG